MLPRTQSIEVYIEIAKAIIVSSCLVSYGAYTNLIKFIPTSELSQGS